MERRYVSLRSAPPQHESGSGAWGLLETPDVKRPRIGVSIACNTCRQKKVRCDGQRPVCTNCLGATSQCAYRDESDLSQESAKLVVELIRMLNSMPATEAIRTVRVLGTETNAPIILSTLRDVASTRCRPSVDTSVAAMSGDAPEPLEFEIQNPRAYPVLPGQDPSELDEASRPGRYASLTQGWATCSDPNSGERPSPSPGSSYELAYNLSSRSPSASPGRRAGGHREASPPGLCDHRLRELKIRRWTSVDIDDEMAAKCISLYLETDHPLLGHFDPELFVSHLVSNSSVFCSSLLVNALLYWACQMYSSIDPDTDGLAIDFCTEAERLWAIERRNERDSLMNIAAAEFLCLGYLGQGRDHAIVAYVSEASRMGERMGLFGTQCEEPTKEPSEFSRETAEATRARKYAAWGVYNWITLSHPTRNLQQNTPLANSHEHTRLMSLFYRQPGISAISQPPSIAIPEPNTPHEPDVHARPADQGRHQPISSGYMGHTFPYICRFWRILSEVSEVYSGDGRLPWGSGGSLSFAEFKFRELLAWSNSMPSRLPEIHQNPHHVQILHLWFHAAILDIFRPHIQERSAGARHLRTFAGMAVTPDAVCDSSVAQLKYLITNYRLNYQSSAYTILWHTALIYVINAILNGPREENWYSDILLCVYAYESLGRSWRVAGYIAKGLLSLIMQKSDVPSRTACRILHDIERNPDHFPGEIRATFMADLNLAMLNPGSATVEHLAKRFEDNVLLKDYTTVLDNFGER